MYVCMYLLCIYYVCMYVFMDVCIFLVQFIEHAPLLAVVLYAVFQTMYIFPDQSVSHSY
jgi:hypothetical protein